VHPIFFFTLPCRYISQEKWFSARNSHRMSTEYWGNMHSPADSSFSPCTPCLYKLRTHSLWVFWLERIERVWPQLAHLHIPVYTRRIHEWVQPHRRVCSVCKKR
jgi:hypothetical protein